MGGSEFMQTAFVDKKTCEIECGKLKEEWISYKPVEEIGEKISGNRIIIKGTVYSLNKIPGKEALKIRAKNKLTKEECRALGI